MIFRDDTPRAGSLADYSTIESSERLSSGGRNSRRGDHLARVARKTANART